MWFSTLILSLACQSAAPAEGGLDHVIELLDLREITLRDALRLLAEESGVNLVASEDAAGKQVSCYLLNLSVRQAIETLAKSYGLWYREDPNSLVVRVLTAREFERDLMQFRDEKTAVFTLLFPNALDVALAIRNLFGSRVQFELDRESMFDQYDELNQRLQRFDLLDRRAQSLGLFGGSTTNFFGLNGFSSYNNGSQNFQNGQFQDSRNYNQQQDRYQQQQQQQPSRPALTPEQLAAMEKQLAESGPQGLDPALLEKLRGTQTSIYVTIVRRNNMIAVRSADSGAMREIERVVRALDVPTPQVLLEVRVLNLDLGDDFNSVFEFIYNGTNNRARLSGTQDLAGNGGTNSLIKPATFVYQYVNDHFLSRLQLLEERNRVTTLATPMLLVANGEVARLFVGEEVPIVQNISSQTTVTDNNVVTTPSSTVEIRPVGTTLFMTPNINADRTVTLRVLEEQSEVHKNGATIPVVTSDGNVINQPVDTVVERTVSGTVVAKDNFTLAIGGLIEEGVRDVQSGIPGLMDLPLIGFLFRSEEKARTRRELVVIVRPYVLFTATEGEAISRELADRLVQHPSGLSLDSLGSFDRSESPRPPLTSDPLKEMFKYQSGLPDGR